MTLADQIEALLGRATPRHDSEMRTTSERLAYDNLAKLAYHSASTILTSLREAEALRAEIARLREALSGIEEFGFRHTGYGYSCAKLAQAALKGTGHE